MTLDQDLASIAVLTEPQRRRVFDQVLAAGSCTVNELVGRLGVGRTLVAFHLGKLLEAGVVEVVAAEREPGARGRPARRYRVTRREVVVSVPERRYALLAGVLLDSVAGHRPGETAHDSALRAARRRGADLGRRLGRGRPARSAAARLGRLQRLLSDLGYVPARDGEELTVRNCPFDRFRTTHAAQVCSLNRALSDGYLEGLGLDAHLQTSLRPSADACCVVFGARSA